jgi:hypothetical protein
MKETTEKIVLVQWYAYPDELKSVRGLSSTNLFPILKPSQQSKPLKELILTSTSISQSTGALKSPIVLASSPFSSDNSASYCCYRFIPHDKKSSNIIFFQFVFF